GLDRRSAVSELNQFPGKGWLEEHAAFIPEVDVVGEHQVDILVILAGEHGIAAADLPREHGHALVFGGWTVQGNESELEEVGSLDQLWHHDPAIESGERRVVDMGSMVFPEANEARVLDAVTLGGCGWKKNTR